jgi:predicted component of type VI protein secretion system
MSYFEKILADFKDGTEKQRLDLYMQYRNLRSDFDRIENEELASLKTELKASQKVVLKPNKINDRQSSFVRIKRWCFSILS